MVPDWLNESLEKEVVHQEHLLKVSENMLLYFFQEGGLTTAVL